MTTLICRLPQRREPEKTTGAPSVVLRLWLCSACGICGILFICAMLVFVVLLRAVNVGGTGKLPMSQLKAMCEAAGFESVQTYIASGNVVFRSAKSESQVKAALEAKLESHAGKRVGVLVRTAVEVAAVLKENPFPQAAPSRTMAIFLDVPPSPDTLMGVTGQKDEQIRLGRREIYVHYGEGMAASKLKIPGAQAGTARNMNTVAKLVEIASSLSYGYGKQPRHGQ
jgi:uncharacterized protein (DUF1697 family)